MRSERGPSPERAPTGATRRKRTFTGSGLKHELKQTGRRPVPSTDRAGSWSTDQRGRTGQAPRPNRVTIMPQTIEATSVMTLSRCGWATSDPLYIAYHDREWGTPLHDDRGFFELLILEGAQAGLSWITILRKRESYRSAFDNFEPSKVAGYGERKLAELFDNPGIIRNRLKIEAAVVNAKAFIEVRRHFGSFDTYIWQFVNHTPVQNSRRGMGDIPSSSKESDAMSKDLRKRGFKFVGTTICYAFMQATGMVNDHVVDCFRYAELAPPQLKR